MATVWCARTRLPLNYRCELDYDAYYSSGGPSPRFLGLCAHQSATAAVLEMDSKGGKGKIKVAMLTGAVVPLHSAKGSSASEAAAQDGGRRVNDGADGSGGGGAGGAGAAGNKRRSSGKRSKKAGDAVGGAAGSAGGSGGAGGRAGGRKGKGSKGGGRPR